MDAAVRQALEEDIGSGDITSELTIPENLNLKGVFLAKERGVIAGLEVAKEVFRQYDRRVAFTQSVGDGDEVEKGTVIASVTGSGRSILSCERVALNFLQRMSGIATQTRAFVDRVKGTKAIILDTRKTAPGLRIFDKWAVRLGGGHNHRFGLFDMILIKDNHIAACGSITRAVASVRKKTKKPIEVEVTSLPQLTEALSLRPERIMLDNMSVAHMRKAVRLAAGSVSLEASGNVHVRNVRRIANTGVDYISVGSLTHSVKALNISLEISQNTSL